MRAARGAVAAPQQHRGALQRDRAAGGQPVSCAHARAGCCLAAWFMLLYMSCPVLQGSVLQGNGVWKLIGCTLQVFARISAYRDRMDGPQVRYPS